MDQSMQLYNGGLVVMPAESEYRKFSRVDAQRCVGCDHRGEPYNAYVFLRCGQCGLPLGASPALLAHTEPMEAERLTRLWHAAGCPAYSAEWGWVYLSPEYTHWSLVQHPAFASYGGIPIHESYTSVWAAVVAGRPWQECVEEMRDGSGDRGCAGAGGVWALGKVGGAGVE